MSETNENPQNPPGQAGVENAVEASTLTTSALQAAQEALVPSALVPAAATPITITDEAQLRAALSAAQGKVLLDFVSKDCEACDEEKVLLDNLAASCTGTTVLTVDVDELPHVADALKANGTPTLYLGTGKDFLDNLERGSKKLEEGKSVGRLTGIKEVEPDERLLRKLKCARGAGK